jgi:hypothetical protein
MAFKPKNSGKSSNAGTGEDTRNFPVPKGGPRKARVSLIVDLGEQNREDFEDPKTKELKPQKPAYQVAVFADLVSDVVDYGGKVGKAQYRLMLNKSFQGVVQGINFQAVPPRDADGNMIEGKKWGLHPANLLTKLAKAVDLEEITIDDGPNGMDISLLLNQPFMAQVEVKETEGKKKDAEGNPIIYKNVNFKGASPIPMIEDDDGNEAPMPVAKLTQPARCITFDDATVEDIQFIRGNLLTMIKNANDYAGSQMQKAVEEFEAKNKGSNAASDEGEAEQEAPAKPATKTAKKPAAPKKPVPQDDMDDDVPF